jgi:hypothetical protein
MPQRRKSGVRCAPDQGEWNFSIALLSNRPPAFSELAGLPADTHPALHEWQILGEAGWQWQHARRIAKHCRRVQEQYLRHNRNRGAGGSRGKRNAVQCVELAMTFDSASAAARFVGRAPGNILRAVRLGRECGGYRWKQSPDCIARRKKH